MKLKIGNDTVILLEGEYIECNDLSQKNMSISGLKDKDRAEELKVVLIALYPYVNFEKEEPVIINEVGLGFEVAFASDEFCPKITC